MFSPFTIGFLAALSCATWVYTQTMRRTGNNNKSSLVAAAVAGGITFVFVLTIVWTIDSMIGDK